MEDCAGLPSLPDLLDELNRDVDLSSLEEITQSLLQDIAADLEASAQKANCQESNRITKKCSEQMVGKTSERVESDRCESVNKEKLENEISQYLLLHHDYFAKQDTKQSRTKRKMQLSSGKKSTAIKDRSNAKRKFKEILPKIEVNRTVDTCVLDVKPEITVDGAEPNLVYGTYDEKTNCIIIVNDDNLRLDEAVTEVITTSDESVSMDSDYLQTPKTDYSRDSVSPTPSSGYESIGSPNSEVDVWDECVSELFPSLI